MASIVETFQLPLLAIWLGALLAGVVAVALARSREKLRLPPGPIAVPVFGNWLQVAGDLNQRTLSALTRKYGDIMHLTMGQKHLVIVSSPSLAKEVLVNQGVEFGSRASNLVFDIFGGNGEDLVFCQYGDHWRRMRRTATASLFTQKMVKVSQPAWNEEINAMISDVKERKESITTGIVIRHRLELLVYNVLYGLIFGKRFESEQDPIFVKLKALNGERVRLGWSFTYNYADFIPFLRPFARNHLNKCEDVMEHRFRLFKTCFVDERRKLHEEAKGKKVLDKCAIDYMLEAQRRGEITEDNILYLLENLNIAGTDTTVRTTDWAIAELVNNIGVQQKLRKELDDVLGRDKNNLVEESDISRLPYLQAVVKETLRLHMPAPLLLPRMNLLPAKLGGYDIPAQSKVVINAWWMSNNPALWDNPEEYRPERFFENGISSNIDISGGDMRFFPFGLGRRNCPGMVIGFPLMCMVVGRLVQCFHLCTPPAIHTVDMTEGLGQFSLQIANCSPVVLKPRSLEKP